MKIRVALKIFLVGTLLGCTKHDCAQTISDLSFDIEELKSGYSNTHQSEISKARDEVITKFFDAGYGDELDLFISELKNRREEEIQKAIASIKGAREKLLEKKRLMQLEIDKKFRKSSEFNIVDQLAHDSNSDENRSEELKAVDREADILESLEDPKSIAARCVLAVKRFPNLQSIGPFESLEICSDSTRSTFLDAATNELVRKSDIVKEQQRKLDLQTKTFEAESSMCLARGVTQQQVDAAALAGASRYAAQNYE